MPYIGRSTDGFGVRNRFLFVASANDTSVSGADANGATLTFTDGAYVDVYLNGVLLKSGTDYNTNTANTIAGLSALSANDEVTVVVYDVFTVADMVSATSGGTFSGGVTVGSTLDVTGNVSLDGGSFVFNESSADKDFRIESNGDANMLFVDGGNDRVGVGTGTPSVNLHIVEDSTEGTPTYAGATHLAVQASASSGDNCNIAITSGSAGTSRIMFGDKDDEDTGKIEYDNSGNDLKFYSNTYERMRLASNGMIEIMTQNTGSAGAAINFGYRTTDFYATNTSSSPAEQQKGGAAFFREGGPDLDKTTFHFANPRSHGWSMFYMGKINDGTNDNRYIDFYWNGSSAASIGSIRGDGSNVSYNTSSDYRLKENVVNSDLDKLYSEVKSLKVKTYNMKTSPDVIKYGFLAHEAKDVWDYICDKPKDAMKDDIEGGTKDADGNPAKVPDYQQLDYGKFTPMIMGALQKAMEKIETLETKVETLEAKVKALEEA